MNCWHCKTELSWESDVDIDAYEGEWELNEQFSMITFLSCPNCGSAVEVFKKK